MDTLKRDIGGRMKNPKNRRKTIAYSSNFSPKLANILIKNGNYADSPHGALRGLVDTEIESIFSKKNKELLGVDTITSRNSPGRLSNRSTNRYE